MVGIVVIAHGNLAQEFLSAARFITGGEGALEAVALDHNVDVANARQLVKDAIRAMDHGSGVLVMTDLYGGAPSNICMSLQNDMKFEILSGVNLPILIKAVSLQKNNDLETMARKLKEYGKENIYLASDFLAAKDEKGKNSDK